MKSNRLVLALYLLAITQSISILCANIRKTKSLTDETFKLANSFTVNIGVKGFKIPCEDPDGSGPIYWYRNGKLVDSGTNKKLFKIKALKEDDSGVYECANSNNTKDPSLKVYSKHKLLVQPMTLSHLMQNDYQKPNHPKAPRLIRTDKDDPQNIVKVAGRSVRMKCRFAGEPEPEVRWLLNGGNVERIHSDYMEMNSTDLYLENLAPSDDGLYSCVAENSHGTSSYTYHLSVTPFQPSRPFMVRMNDAHAIEGGTVTWVCDANGGAEPMYEWYRIVNKTKDGLVTKYKLDTADPRILTITNITSADFGGYECVARNNFGDDSQVVYLLEDFKHHLPMMIREKENIRRRYLIVSGGVAAFAVCVAVYALAMKMRMRKKRVTIIQAKQSFIIRKKVIIEQRDSDKTLLSPHIKIEEERVHVDPQDQDSAKVMNQYQFQLDPDWEISRTCLEFDPEPIGEGAFGIVYKADAYGLIPNTDRIEVAIKMLKNGHTESDLRDLVTEMEVMKKVQGGRHTHKNIINLLGCVTQDGPLAVVVEFAPNGNLRDFLQKRKSCWEYEVPFGHKSEPGKLSLKKLINYGYQIAQGMEYLASKNCIHRDLAARNVLVMSDETLKIADFGLARDIYAHDYYRKTTHGRLPVKWMAPETLSINKYTTASDVWSFGITLWEITTLGETPYSTVRHEDLPALIKKGYRLSKPTYCPRDLYHLMQHTWQYDPSKRPPFAEIVRIMEKMLMNDCYLDLNTAFLDGEGSCETGYDSELEDYATEMDSLRTYFAHYENQPPHASHVPSAYQNQEVVQQQMNRMNPVYFSSDPECWQHKLHAAREDTV